MLQHLLERTSNAVNTAVACLVMGLSLSMAGVILLQVFFRYVLNNSLFWSEELGRMLLVWLSFMGASVAYKRGAHMGVAVLVERLPQRAKHAAACCAHLAAMALFWVMFWHGARFFSMLAPQMTVSLGISRQWPFLAVPLSGAVMLLHALFFLQQDLQALLQKGDKT